MPSSGTDDNERGPSGPSDAPAKPRVVVLTMVRDEADMLPRWIDYYGAQLGMHSLIVLDDNSVDGSTNNLPCTVYRLPPEPWKHRWGRTRARLVNGMASGLLACNDVVIFTDVDEFLVADPSRHSGLLDYLGARADRPVIAPVGLELIHHVQAEPPLEPTRPVLEQRRFVKFAPAMCKPLVKRVPDQWQPAFHGIYAPFEVDADLWMLHLKYSDEASLRKTAERRHRAHEVEGRGSSGSFWSKTPQMLGSLLASWTDSTQPSGEVAEFTVDELGLDELIRPQGDGSWRPNANQVTGLSKSPLRELPPRFRTLF